MTITIVPTAPRCPNRHHFRAADLIAYLFSQRWLMSGVMRGAVK